MTKHDWKEWTYDCARCGREMDSPAKKEDSVTCCCCDRTTELQSQRDSIEETILEIKRSLARTRFEAHGCRMSWADIDREHERLIALCKGHKESKETE